MELKVENQIENSLLERIELTFSITHQGEKPPRKDYVREVIGKHFNVKKDLVVIHTMSSIFGTQEMDGSARVYKNPERLQDVERQYLLKRNALLKKKDEEAKASETTEKAVKPGASTGLKDTSEESGKTKGEEE